MRILLTGKNGQVGWELQRTLSFMQAERGRQFDPQCVDALLFDMDEVFAIQQQFAEPDNELRSAA